MPVEMSLLAADLIHNTRTALDHILARLKEHFGGNPGKGSFPTWTSSATSSLCIGLNRARIRWSRSTGWTTPTSIGSSTKPRRGTRGRHGACQLHSAWRPSHCASHAP
jgi:hypothetical protein